MTTRAATSRPAPRPAQSAATRGTGQLRYSVGLVRVAPGLAVVGVGIRLAQQGQLSVFERRLFRLDDLPGVFLPTIWAVTGADDADLSGDVAELMASLAMRTEPALVVDSALPVPGPDAVASTRRGPAPLSRAAVTRAEERAGVLPGVAQEAVDRYPRGASPAAPGTVDALERSAFGFVNGWPDAWRPGIWAVQLLGVRGAPRVVAALALVLRQWRLALVLLEALVRRQRPGTTIPGADVPDVPTAGSSFPSGHAIIAFGIATLLLLLALDSVAHVYLGGHAPLPTGRGR